MTNGGLYRLAISIGMVLTALAFQPCSVQAQVLPFVPCPAQIDLSKSPIPEIVTDGGTLRGLIVLRNAQESLPASPGNCVPQLLRFYQDKEAAGPLDPNIVLPPQPGPTLRARLGDVVQLTFLNQINPLDYGASQDGNARIDRAENGIGTGCDQTTAGYPNLGIDKSTGLPVIDTMPNCFHGSSTGNLHFHGTHTSPTSTGDNVFLGIRPSPRADGKAVITEATFKQEYDTFFEDCSKSLRANNLNQWPRLWTDMPPAWTKAQEVLLKAYDTSNPQVVPLWPVDEAQIAAKVWPQYYIGSFPYCFVLPDFPETLPASHASHQAGTPAPGLRMGQSPGTHWYHAHKHGSTAINVSNGMVGAFIIEGKDYDGVLNGFYNQYRTDQKTDWTRQQPVIVVNQLSVTPAMERGSGGTGPFSVNGAPQPDMTMYPGEVKLWRIVNGSSISGFYLSALPAGFQWRQTAQDGVQFDDDNYQFRAQRPVYVAPGNRIDLLVQAPMTAGTFPLTVKQGVSVARTAAATSSVILFNIIVTGAGPAMPLMPTMSTRQVFLRDIPASDVTNHRTIVFNSTGGGGQRQHTVGTALEPYNGTKFNPDNPLKIDNVNVVEEWTIYNTTTGPRDLDHPFHIHVNPFQVTEVFSPNAPLTYTNGQIVYATGTSTPVPLYIISTSQPTLLPGQCWLNPGDKTTWIPCAATPPTQPGGQNPPVAKANIWWDVFPIPAAAQSADKTVTIPGYFKMRSRFVDYQGAYVMHCHILAHEDRGMMMSVQVGLATPATLYQHH